MSQPSRTNDKTETAAETDSPEKPDNDLCTGTYRDKCWVESTDYFDKIHEGVSIMLQGCGRWSRQAGVASATKFAISFTKHHTASASVLGYCRPPPC